MPELYALAVVLISAVAVVAFYGGALDRDRRLTVTGELPYPAARRLRLILDEDAAQVEAKRAHLDQLRRSPR